MLQKFGKPHFIVGSKKESFVSSNSELEHQFYVRVAEHYSIATHILE